MSPPSERETISRHYPHPCITFFNLKFRALVILLEMIFKQRSHSASQATKHEVVISLRPDKEKNCSILFRTVMVSLSFRLGGYHYSIFWQSLHYLRIYHQFQHNFGHNKRGVQKTNFFNRDLNKENPFSKSNRCSAPEQVFFNGSTALYGPRPSHFSRLHDHTQAHHTR